jgi:hypothetical protein
MSPAILRFFFKLTTLPLAYLSPLSFEYTNFSPEKTVKSAIFPEKLTKSPQTAKKYLKKLIFYNIITIPHSNSSIIIKNRRKMT